MILLVINNHHSHNHVLSIQCPMILLLQWILHVVVVKKEDEEEDVDVDVGVDVDVVVVVEANMNMRMNTDMRMRMDKQMGEDEDFEEMMLIRSVVLMSLPLRLPSRRMPLKPLPPPPVLINLFQRPILMPFLSMFPLLLLLF